MKWARIAMILVATGQWWDISFTANSRNVAIQVVTECKGKEPFYAVDEYPIDGDTAHVRMRRQNTPHGARCTVLAGTVDEDKFYTESAIVIQED